MLLEGLHAFEARTLPTAARIRFPLSTEKPPSLKADENPDEVILAHRFELMKLAYANLEQPRQHLIEEMSSHHPELPKKTIERVFKELLVKEKRGRDLKSVYYAANEELLVEICTYEQIEELQYLAIKRMAPLLEDQQREEERALMEREEREQRKWEARMQ